MPVQTKYIKIKNTEIPINIKNYKNAKSVKIFFKGETLIITKPKKLAIKYLSQILAENENDIYAKYQKIKSSEVTTIKQWETGEKIHYKGIEFDVVKEYQNTDKINVRIEEESRRLRVILPQTLENLDIKQYIDKSIKQLFKINTESLIATKLLYWSKITGIGYNSVKVRDATTRYGSCMPTKKNVYFSSRLIMLPEDKVDAIIVHELCHMKHRNHNKQFYNLVEQYIPNYKEIDKWLKINGKIIMF